MTNYNFIGIGINHYQYLQPLTYAQADIQTLDSFFRDEIRVNPNQTLTFTDNSSWIYEQSTYPTQKNLLDWLQLGFQNPQKSRSSGSAVLWFAFSGYGVQHNGEDYLLPVDGKLNDPVGTGISVRLLFDALLKQGASKVIVLMDMNRSTTAMGSKVGEQTLELAGKMGIAAVLSCRPDEFSHETSALGHGMFTAALLEALRYYRSDLTLELLNNYLGDRLKELSDHHWRPVQTPVMVIPSLAASRELIVPSGEATKIYWQTAVPMGASLASMNGDRPDLGFSASTNGHGHSSHITMSIEGEAMNTEQTDDLPMAADADGDLFGEEPEIYHDFGAATDEPPFTPDLSDEALSNGDLSDDDELTAFDEAIEQEPDPTQPATMLHSADPAPTRERPWFLAGWQWLALLLYLLLGALGWRFFGGYNAEPPVVIAPVPTQVKEQPSATEKPTEAAANPATTEKPATGTETNPAQSTDTKGTTPTPNVDGTGTTQASQSGTPTNDPTKTGTAPTVAPQNGQQPAKSKPSTSPTTNPASVPSKGGTAQTQNAEILTEANLVLRSSQASSFSQAIAAARAIKPGTPMYAEAQVQISRWSRVILDIAEARAIKGDFTGAIAAARLVPPNVQQVSGTAQKSITKWQSQITIAAKNRQVIVDAQELIVANQASSYSRAINLLKTIKPSEPSYTEAIALQKQWSRTIYLLANSRAAQKKFKVAVATAKLIPADSPSYKTAQAAIARWQKNI